MFTGIVEEVGKISKIEVRGENRRITITANEHAEGTWDRSERFGQRRLPDRARYSAKFVLRRSRAGNLANELLLSPTRRARW